MSESRSGDKLVRMANDIANFFKVYGETAAIAGIRHHVESFWTPAMRSALQRRAAAGDVTGLHPYAAAAMREPPVKESPAERESAGPATAGEIGASDAG